MGPARGCPRPPPAQPPAPWHRSPPAATPSWLRRPLSLSSCCESDRTGAPLPSPRRRSASQPPAGHAAPASRATLDACRPRTGPERTGRMLRPRCSAPRCCACVAGRPSVRCSKPSRTAGAARWARRRGRCCRPSWPGCGARRRTSAPICRIGWLGSQPGALRAGAERRRPSLRLADRAPASVCTLRQIRRARGLTRERVAADAGVNIGLVSRLERLDVAGLATTPIGSVLRVASSLGLSCSELLPVLAARPRRSS